MKGYVLAYIVPDTITLLLRLRQLAMMSGGAMTPAVVAGLVEMMNGHYLRGLKKMKE